MEKTEMMKRYEAETGKKSVRVMTDGIHAVAFDVWHFEYINWLEAKANISDEAIEAFQEIIRNQCDEISALKEKAEAYDKLMSGGVITKKDVANIFGKVLVMTPNGYWQLWFSKPRRDKWGWHLDGGDTKSIGHTIAHFSDLNIIHDGSWKDSLTLPDGWEEK